MSQNINYVHPSRRDNILAPPPRRPKKRIRININPHVYSEISMHEENTSCNDEFEEKLYKRIYEDIPLGIYTLDFSFDYYSKHDNYNKICIKTSVKNDIKDTDDEIDCKDDVAQYSKLKSEWSHYSSKPEEYLHWITGDCNEFSFSYCSYDGVKTYIKNLKVTLTLVAKLALKNN